jgi:thioredoxin reductase (NADPH)
MSSANEGDCFEIKTSGGGTYNSKTLVLTMGAKRRRLGLPMESELTGRGVHYCVTCDGPVYAGKDVAIIGGGDASVKGALDIAHYVRKIYFLVRSDSMRAEPTNIEKLKKLGDQIDILYKTEVKSFIVDSGGNFSGLELTKEFNGSTKLLVSSAFVEIGAVPNNELAKSVGVSVDSNGYLNVNNDLSTNVPGVFAAGDGINLFGVFKQAITAAATGAVAATSAYNYQKQRGELCRLHLKPAQS